MFFSENSSPKSHEIPIVSADNSPYKVKPVLSGGIKVINLDKTIYEAYTQSKNAKLLTNSKNISILSPPERPMYLDFKQPKNSIDIIIEALTNDPNLTPNSHLEGDNENAFYAQNLRSLKIIKLDKPDYRLQSLLNSEHRGVKLKKYRLYLGSAYSISLAEDLRKQIVTNNTKILSNYQYIIQPISIEDNKLMYNVLAGDFSSFNDAQMICKRLIANQQHCLVVKY